MGGFNPMMKAVARAVASGVEWIQLREKHCSSKELAQAARQVIQLARQGETKVIINSRIDVALACGADGVHLPSDSLAPNVVRRIAPKGFLIGVSTHSLEDALQAYNNGASYVLFSPIFQKPGYSPAQGLAALRLVCESVPIPVLALGGITAANALECMEAGAAGVAGISMFQNKR